MSTVTRITTDDIEELSPSEILLAVQGASGVLELVVPLPNIGSTQDPGNIAIDYAQALLIGEKLASLSRTIRSRRVYQAHSCAVHFDMTLDRLEDGVRLLYELMCGLYVDCDEWAHSEASEMFDRLYDQDTSLCLHFPDLADDYMANLLHAADIWEENPGSRRRYEKKFPETKYGYSKSFGSKQFGFPLYLSPVAWAAPPSVDLAAVLSTYGFAEPRRNVELEPAQVIQLDGHAALLVSEHQAVPAPVSATNDASHFTMKCRPFGVTKEGLDRPWCLSKCGEVVVMQSQFGQHIVFCDAQPPGNRLLAVYLERCEQVADRLRRLLGVTIHTPCAWKRLSDESFELLCYDVTRRIARFDESTVRKMGNARSRDGGRDIMAMTRARPGSDPRKWIIQCKLVTSKRSLSSGAISVSDTIDQYAAAGYMVFTNAVIDSTVYDRLEAIGKNRQIEVDAWSGMELERFLQGHRDLLARYFP
jgi:hypothetical protein